MLAVNWAVFSFVMVVVFVIALALPQQFIKFAVSFPTGFILAGIFAISLHSLIIFLFVAVQKTANRCRIHRWKGGQNIGVHRISGLLGFIFFVVVVWRA